MNQRLSSLSALIFMTHGNFDTEKVLVTFSRVKKFFYFSRKLQSGNDLINARFLSRGLRACQFGATLAVRHAEGLGREGLKERKRQQKRGESRGGRKRADRLSQCALILLTKHGNRFACCLQICFFGLSSSVHFALLPFTDFWTS